MRFKLKFGQHIQANPDFNKKTEGENPDVKKSLVFNADGSGAGNVIETDVDLIKLLGDSGKFVRLGDKKGTRATATKLAQPRSTVPTPGLPSEPDDEEEIEDEDDSLSASASEEQLSHMTVAQLKEYAADHEIDLKGAVTKSAILASILAKG